MLNIPFRLTIGAACSAAAVALLTTGCATPERTDPNTAKLVSEYVAQSFVAGPGQDLTRLQQDQTQIDCTNTRANPPDALAVTIRAREAKNMVYPDDGKLMGDWKAGRKVFNDGFAYRIGSFIPSSPNAVRGGNCYACHQGEAGEAAWGNLGSTLQGFGKLRGQSEPVVKYTYEKIYNSRAYNACSAMPRLGHNKILSPKQVADLTAYLLSPESPVNK